MKALVDQEGKLERQNRAETNLNQNTENYKGSEESRREERRPENDINYRGKGNETIKIGAHNINGIKGDYMKVEQLAEYGKSEGYNIIGIIETNIGEQEGKWVNTKEYGFASFWTEPEKGKHKGSGIGLLVDQNWLKNMGVCKRFSPYLLKAEFFFRRVVFQVWIVYLPPKNEEVTRKVHKILIEEITKNKKNMYYTILGDFNIVLSKRLDMSSEERRSTDTGTRVTK